MRYALTIEFECDRPHEAEEFVREMLNHASYCEANPPDRLHSTFLIGMYKVEKETFAETA